MESEVFTALSHLERLVNIELELADALEEYIIEQEERLKMLKWFAEDVSNAMDQAKEDRYAYLGHPVSSFLMVKRFVNQWPRIEKSIQQEGDSEGKYNGMIFSSFDPELLQRKANNTMLNYC